MVPTLTQAMARLADEPIGRHMTRYGLSAADKDVTVTVARREADKLLRVMHQTPGDEWDDAVAGALAACMLRAVGYGIELEGLRHEAALRMYAQSR